ncbi:MAG: DUF4328 domain-containing protein [Gammaproteobacteria bacterium]|nr:DUF4328 domain-containing protein [Gammaproteobacteria bacterium]
MTDQTNNPYAAPTSDIETSTRLTFENPTKKANLAIKAFYAVLAVYVTHIITQIWRIGTFKEYLATQANWEELEKGDQIEGTIGIILGLVTIVLIIFFLRWFHQCYKNVIALEADSLEHSPGWAVGWFFIPFANLVKPYSVAAEMWKASSPKYPSEDRLSSWRLAETGWVVPMWWFTFLASSVFERIVLTKTRSASSLEDYLDIASLDIASSIVTIGGIISALIFIKKLSERQNQRFNILTQS